MVAVCIMTLAINAIIKPINGLYAELILLETIYIVRAKSVTCNMGYIINVSISRMLADVSIIVLMLNKPVMQFIITDNAKIPKIICTIIFDFSFLYKVKTYTNHIMSGIR